MEDLVKRFTEITSHAHINQSDIKSKDNGVARIGLGPLVELQKYSSKRELLEITNRCISIIQQIQKLADDPILKAQLRAITGFKGPKFTIIPQLYVIEYTAELHQNVEGQTFIEEVISKLDPHSTFSKKVMKTESTTSYYQSINPKDITAVLKQNRLANYEQLQYNFYYNTISDDAHILFKDRIPKDSTVYVLNDITLDSRAALPAMRQANQIFTNRCLTDLFLLKKACRTQDILEVNKKFEEIANTIKVEAETAANDSILLDDKREIDLVIRNNIAALSFLIQNSTDNNSALSSAARNQITDLNKEFQKKHPFLSGKYFDIHNGLRMNLLKTDLLKLAHNETESLASAWMAMFPGANAPFAEFAKDTAERNAKELEIRQKDQANFKFIKAPHFKELYKSFFAEDLKL